MSFLYDIQPAPSTHLEGARLTSLPILLLNVHSQCNCRCVMCDIWKRKDGSECHVADLERHRESIKKLGVMHVVLSGGEPLLNRELDAICSFFHALGLRITLLTTGLLLQKKAALVAGFDDIIISIDGPPEIHDQIRRVPGAFRTIRRGVLAVREIRPEILITCRTTVQKLNHTHLRATVSAARSLGLDSISFLPADTSSVAFNREDGWTPERQSEITLNRTELVELEREIELLIQTCRADIDKHFIAENDAKLRRIGVRFRERIEGIPPKSPICNAPWVSAVMEVDGTIRPCFFHPSIGNAHQLTLEEVINSEAGLSFRSRLNVANDPTCQRCVCSLNYPR
jgi:MoaA/NifB/PqqE/SkfB family radical SAM enzyme